VWSVARTFDGLTEMGMPMARSLNSRPWLGITRQLRTEGRRQFN